MAALTRSAALVLALLWPVLAAAQTGTSESCEKATANQPTAVAKVGEKVAVGFCGDSVDYAEPVLRDGGTRDARDEARFIRDGAPAGNGLFFFATKLLDFAPGTHALTIDYMKLTQGDVVVTAMPRPLVLTVLPVTTDPCDGVVTVAVGDWTRLATAGDSAQVFWSLGRSKEPITAITVYIDDIPAPSTADNPNPKTGDDLRGFTGSRFRVPAGAGTRNLSLMAQSESGCKGVADRLMPLVVR